MASEPIHEDVESWGEVAAVVLRNWRAELAALFDEMRDAVLQGDSASSRLVVHQREATLFLDPASGEPGLGPFELSAEGARGLEARLADDDAPRTVDVAVQFDDDIVLRPQATLPRASRRSLIGAFRFELGRKSPVAVEDLYYDCVVVEPNKRSRRVDVIGRALRRRTVDEAVSFAHDAGLAVAAIRLGHDRRPADWRHFPVDRGALLRALWSRWGSALLGGLAALLLVAILVAMGARDAERTAALDARIAAAQVPAAAVERLERNMAQIRRQSAFVASRKSQPTFLATWAALSDLLPDGTWLIDIQLDAGKLHIQGYSHAASDLIGRLDRSGRFSNAQFAAPLVRNDADGTERFDLTAHVVGVR